MRARISQAAGASTLLLGILVLAGWLLDVGALKGVLPGLATMKANTAVCFMLAGSSLMLASKRPMAASWGARICALAVLAVAVLTMLQDVLRVEFGIDQLIVRDPDSLTDPGRMATATATGFALAAAALLILTQARPSPGRLDALTLLSTSVAAVGALGVVGYALHLDALYSWYAYRTVALHTAVGLVVLGTGIWAGKGRFRYGGSEEQRITALAVWLLVAATAVTAIVSFAAMERTIENTLAAGVQTTLETQTAQAGAMIDRHMTETAAIAASAHVRRSLRDIAQGPGKEDTRRALQEILEDYAAHGFRSLQLRSAQADIARAGTAVEAPDMEQRLLAPIGAALLWKDGLYLRNRQAIGDSQGALGTLIAERYLQIASPGAMKDRNAIGETAQWFLCAPGLHGHVCFPSRPTPNQSIQAPGIEGLAALLERALLSGPTFDTALDQHGRRVFVGAMPVGRLDLVAIFKVDTREIYRPVGLQIQLTVLLIAAISIAGYLLMQRLVRPLAADLEQRARQRTAELARTMQQLRDSHEALLQSNMELSRFTYIACHDLQSPLRSISGFIQLLKSEYAGRLDAQADDWIQRIVHCVRDLQRLMRDLLEYSRIDAQTNPFAPVQMDDACDQSAALLAGSVAEAGANLTRDAMPVVLGDRAQLVQLLCNLVGNAIKYRSDSPPRVHVSARRNEGCWVFSVRDNGIGIAPKHREQIFEVFRRLHGASEIPGTGIGLAISRRIVLHHGGRIWVESEPGKGSTFFFTIPDATAGAL